MAKTKPKPQKSSLLKPGLLTLATVFFWAAMHEPEVFDPASLGIWMLSALTVALVTRAALALASPVLGLLLAALAQALTAARNEVEP